MRWFRRLRERWHDIDWCDKHIVPTRLSDDEVLRALALVHPYSFAVAGLLSEAGKRGLKDAVTAARGYTDNVEPEAAIEAAGVLRLFGTPEDADHLLTIASDSRWDEHLFAALLEAAAALDPRSASLALTMAEETHSLLARTCIVLALPNDFPTVQELLLQLTNEQDVAPGLRAKIFVRLAALPRTQQVEDFFVSFIINDEGNDPQLSAIAHEALSRR